MKRVRIYPAFDSLYYSFYVRGLMDYFGESAIDFSYRGFPRIPSDSFAFNVIGDREWKIAIAAYDGARLTYTTAIEWCDVYGKVNLESSVIPEQWLPKCLAIGPSFPVRLWSHTDSLRMALRNFSPKVSSVREHFANYVRQYRDRLPPESFVPGTVRENYIFFSATIWDEEEAPGTNQFRASYMEACKSLPGVTFEGGFSPPASPQRAAPYKAHLAPKRYPLSEWLENMKSSMVVFNTPGVWRSHTFKLAEFLALGKAIISTPVTRELPAALIHGEHIHYVDGSLSSFRAALDRIIGDREYRRHLEQNARRYYLTYLQPKTVIDRLLTHGARRCAGEDVTRTAG